MVRKNVVSEHITDIFTLNIFETHQICNFMFPYNQSATAIPLKTLTIDIQLCFRSFGKNSDDQIVPINIILK